jgi:hypothetical protein
LHVAADLAGNHDLCCLGRSCGAQEQATRHRHYRLSISARKTLFTPAERSFLGVLDQALGSEYRVFGKVRVADIASVKPGLGNSARQAALNRIAAKHFDFVVCRASDLSVICAVELNDRSHSSQRAQARDDLLFKVCQTIHLPLLIVPAKHAYSLQEVKARFDAVISSPSLVASGAVPQNPLST